MISPDVPLVIAIVLFFVVLVYFVYGISTTGKK
jgi:cbb3-type cytochrome oxidase subunit 3